MLKDEKKETEKLRALVDNWLLAEKKLNLLSEELVSIRSVTFSFDSFLVSNKFYYSTAGGPICAPEW